MQPDPMKPTTDEQIIRLVSLWYEVIGPLHHKDRDCHFHVERTWSYGATGQYAPKWSFRHHGYLKESPENQYDTMQEAMDGLREYLTEAIMDWADMDPESDHVPGITRAIAQERINVILL
jgi:hypothetical protein